MSRTGDELEVAVIGAGQAGLALGYFLRRQGRRFVILERADSIGSAWRARWESLTLFTPRRYSALPGLPFPGEPDGYPTRDEVIAYLDRYAETFELPIELNSEVTQTRAGVDGRFRLEVGGRTVDRRPGRGRPPGPSRRHTSRSSPSSSRDDVFQTHAVGYRRPDDVPEGTILVVGGGNTGFQIAKELSRRTGRALRRLSPEAAASASCSGATSSGGSRRQESSTRQSTHVLGRKLRTRDTLIGSSPRRAPEALRGRAQAAHRRCRRANGSLRGRQRARGRRRDLGDGLSRRPLLDQAARSSTRRGAYVTVAASPMSPASCFLGLTWQHTRGSALIGWVKHDAEYIAERIARVSRNPPRGSRTRHRQRRRHAESSSSTGGCNAMHRARHRTGTARQLEFPRETEGLPEARKTELVELADGDEFELEIIPVKKRIGDATVRMLAYNGSVPGPTLKVRQGATITVHVTNHGDLEATVHWHGLRLENRYDGTHDTQAPIPVGETLHLPAPCARSRRLLVPPAHPRGLRPGAGPVREHPRHPARARLLAAGEPRAAAHPRRHPDRGRTDRRLQRVRRRRTWRWAASAT